MPNADRVWPPREWEQDELTTGDYRVRGGDGECEYYAETMPMHVAAHVEEGEFYSETFPEDEGEPNCD